MNKEFIKKLVIPWKDKSFGDDKKAQPTSYLQHLCELELKSEATQQRLTKIVCSIGPACRDVSTLVGMMVAGMSVARINMFYGSRDYHEETLANIRKAVAEYSQCQHTNYPLAIAVDLTESGIRTGKLPEGKQIELKAGDEVSVSAIWNLEEGTCENLIFVNHPKVASAVKPGDRFLIDDGEITLLVLESVTAGPMDFDVEAKCIVERGGMLGSQRRVCVPDVPLERPPVTWTDEEDLKWAVDHGVDMVFVPLARDSTQISTIKNVLGEVGKGVHLIARIETNQGVCNIDDILTEADGVLVGRRGLSMELTPERMFLAQKAIVAKCNKTGKIVICGQQMLQSMVQCGDPVRPEIESVACAVMDGCDAIMLSAATASGADPVRTVKAADQICRYAESAMWSYQLFRDLTNLAEPPIDPAHAIAIAVVEACEKCRASAVCVVTTTGRSARLITRYRPRCPIIAVTRFGHTARLLSVCRGILPLQYTRPRLIDWLKDVDKRVHYAAVFGRKKGFIHPGDCLVLVSGWRQGTGFTNTLRIIYTHAPFLEADEPEPDIMEQGDVRDAETMYDLGVELEPDEGPGLPEVPSEEYEKQLLNTLIDNLPIESYDSLKEFIRQNILRLPSSLSSL